MATLKGVWSSSFASSSWSKSWSTSPLRSGTLAIVRTPGPGGMRMQRSGAITPRRAACARSKREVWVGKRSATWRAISAPGGGHADEHRAHPGADAGAGLLAERGVGLVADHDRVGVGDAAGVAHEPLVGLDRDGAVGMVGAVQQRRREPLAVAAVGDLADELVHQVAAVGEDQDAAGARGLDEADRGDGLAGAGGVLEPEAPVGARVLGHLVDDVLVLLGLVPVLGLLVGLQRVIVIGVEVHRRCCWPTAAPLPVALAPPFEAPLALAVLLLELGDQRRQRSREGVHLVIVQLGAVGQVRDVLVQQPLQARASGSSRGATRSMGPRCPRRSRPGRRPARGGGRVPGARSLGFSPSSRKGSRANSRARSISAAVGAFAAFAATLVVSAMRLCDPALLAERMQLSS